MIPIPFFPNSAIPYTNPVNEKKIQKKDLISNGLFSCGPQESIAYKPAIAAARSGSIKARIYRHDSAEMIRPLNTAGTTAMLSVPTPIMISIREINVLDKIILHMSGHPYSRPIPWTMRPTRNDGNPDAKIFMSNPAVNIPNPEKNNLFFVELII